ncbi:hypothetical protein SNE40_013677 [Patella caerulea]|uniref:Uncharacterized protein n=1 Tax=Patella caerulea TaxID=87958 RepID=A0AAN8PR11_PATCE
MARKLSLTCSLIIVYICTTGIDCEECAVDRTHIFHTHTITCLFGCCYYNAGWYSKDICCKPSTGLEVGVSVAGIAILASCIACCYCCCCRQRGGSGVVVVTPNAAPTATVVSSVSSVVAQGYPPQQGLSPQPEIVQQLRFPPNQVYTGMT